jgi:hypothetical protein
MEFFWWKCLLFLIFPTEIFCVVKYLKYFNFFGKSLIKFGKIIWNIFGDFFFFIYCEKLVRTFFKFHFIILDNFRLLMFSASSFSPGKRNY